MFQPDVVVCDARVIVCSSAYLLKFKKKFNLNEFQNLVDVITRSLFFVFVIRS